MDRGRSDFERFVAEVEPRLRRALVAGYGAAVGRQAAADALAWAWQHWERVRAIESPVGYLCFAAPVIAGHLARIMSAHPRLTPWQARTVLAALAVNNNAHLVD